MFEVSVLCMDFLACIVFDALEGLTGKICVQSTDFLEDFRGLRLMSAFLVYML